MMFDTEVSVFQATVGVTPQEAIDDGAQPLIELAVVTGTALPLMNPQTGEPLLVPLGQYRFAFTRKQAVEVFTKALEAAQALPEERAASNISIAHNMGEVAQTAKALKVVQR